MPSPARAPAYHDTALPMRTHQPKVALLIETARGYGRGLLRGIVRCSRLHGGWAFYITPGDFEQALPEMRQWGGTGIIARLETPRIAEAVLATGLPLVALDLSDAQLSDGSPLAGVAEVRSDSPGAARLAAEHLLDRGFRQYAYVGVARRVWSRRRQEGFVARLAEAGLDCHVYPQPRRKRDREWGREQATLAAWLRDLAKPVGVMACNDDRGRQVLEACRAAGVRVPEEAAVIGVDNDELLCDLSTPPLSSVALNTERGGFEAAALLDALMHGRPAAGQRIVVEPLRVETRQSTDVLAVEDREVADALRHIRDRAAEPVQVVDVVRAAGLSRRALEMRFRRAVGRSIHQEIQRVHLDRATHLLMETDLPTARVAEAAGFSSPSYFGKVFRRQMGVTPAGYRTHVRAR
ncbi:MAG: DNA-binding transcriptional regulator [Phycisphaerae bacterium]